MNIVLYDPEPVANDYLRIIYFESLLAYTHDKGIPISRIQSPQEVGNCCVITNGDYLTPKTILRLKENGNKIVSFDINDSSWLSDAYREAIEILHIDRIYKLSGIQKENISKDYAIDEDFGFSLVDKTFLSDEAWTDYAAMRDRGSLQSLPYVPWQHQPVPRVLAYPERSGNVLCRGGNHFGRFVAFLFLMMYGKADALSSFATADYFKEGMTEQFRHCADCRLEKQKTGTSAYWPQFQRGKCTSPAPWGGKLDLSNPGLWNNRCPKSFFWLAEKFNERYGARDPAFVEKALNGNFVSGEAFVRDLSQATAYTDLKWIFSIYVPPRFWEAASCNTVNFLPARTNDQTYFPHVEEGRHFKTFREDFKDFNPEISALEFEEMTRNCSELYETWIRPGKLRLHENLAAKIVGEIEEVANS